jgi:hypothetical protein
MRNLTDTSVLRVLEQLLSCCRRGLPGPSRPLAYNTPMSGMLIGPRTCIPHAVQRRSTVVPLRRQRKGEAGKGVSRYKVFMGFWAFLRSHSFKSHSQFVISILNCADKSICRSQLSCSTLQASNNAVGLSTPGRVSITKASSYARWTDLRTSTVDIMHSPYAPELQGA